MKLAYILLLVVTVVAYVESKSHDLEAWKLFKLKYQKKYTGKKEQERRKIFMETRSFVFYHNLEYKLGLVPFKLEINEYADMTNSELKNKFFGYKKNKASKKQRKLLHVTLKADDNSEPRNATFIPPANVVLPEFVDWRAKGAVTSVKNQYNCGSCWAFSTVGALEGQQFRKTGKLVALSAQDLVDCTRSNYGCYGGSMDEAFNFIYYYGGIDTEEGYPYEGMDKQCRYKTDKNGATVSGYVDIEFGNEEHMKAAVATVGPISVAVDASSPYFTRYSEGVYQDKHCSKVDTNHAMLIVGYGKEQTGEEYWLVKNSWGTDFGDNGYIKMQRNTNQCGIATQASFPLV